MIPAPLSPLALIIYRIALPFRLKRQATIRKAYSQASKRGWATRLLNGDRNA